MSNEHRPHWGDRVLVHVILLALGVIAGMQITSSQVREADEKVTAALTLVRQARTLVENRPACRVEVAHE